MKTRYFQFFSEEYLKILKKRKVRSTMSIEYLTSSPNFRRAQIGFSVGSMLIELGCKVFGETTAQAIIAPARSDIGVNRLAYELGFSCLVPNTIQRGFDCDLIACFQGAQKPHFKESQRQQVARLWETRIVHASAQHFLEKAGKKIEQENVLRAA